MAYYRISSLSITSLMLNLVNPRFEPVESQREAIRIMVQSQKDKLFKLAEDIAKHGLNPSDLIIVHEISGKDGIYSVLEGNRRVTALKILNQVELIDHLDERIKKRFWDLKKEYSDTIPRNINCVVFEDEESANRWIELKHTGENDGVGVVNWDAHSQLRFKERLGKDPKTALQVINYIIRSDNFSEEIKEKTSLVPITSLQRLIDDPDVRSKIGLVMEKREIKTQYSGNEISKGLSKIITDLADGNINVKDIYYKSDRMNYIGGFTIDETPNEDNIQVEISINEKDSNKIKVGGNSIENLKGPNKITKTKSLGIKKSLLERKSLIPSSSKININSPRINDIYLELRKLDVKEFTNSVSVLLRVFIELSADEFISIIKLENICINSSLKNKISKIADYMKEKNSLNEQQLQPINKMISSQHNVISTNTMNAYVHNKELHPSPMELRIIWDNIGTFMEKTWELIREGKK